MTLRTRPFRDGCSCWKKRPRKLTGICGRQTRNFAKPTLRLAITNARCRLSKPLVTSGRASMRRWPRSMLNCRRISTTWRSPSATCKDNLAHRRTLREDIGSSLCSNGYQIYSRITAFLAILFLGRNQFNRFSFAVVVSCSRSARLCSLDPCLSFTYIHCLRYIEHI